MNKNIMWIVVAVVVIIVGGLFVANQQSKKAEETKMMQEKDAMKAKEDTAMKEKAAMEKDKTVDGGKDEAAMMKKQEGIMMMAQGDASSLKGTLADVSGGSATGKAFVLRKDGKLDYTVSATIPDPASGSFYEGWLVKKGSNPVQLVDTGILTKQKDGTYEVSYSSDNTYDGYNFVVITWEQGKVDPANPGKHILEGTVQ